jgi:hypothetical protein
MLCRWAQNLGGNWGSYRHAGKHLLKSSLCQNLVATTVCVYCTATSTSASSVSALPIVYHPSYSAPQLKEGHRFPMAVFGRIHHRLLKHHRLVEQEQVLFLCLVLVQVCHQIRCYPGHVKNGRSSKPYQLLLTSRTPLT